MHVALDPTAARSVVPTRVRFCETDLMGIVHHGAYPAYLELARVEWLRRRGVTYAGWADRGMHLAVVELSLKYRAPARFDDELLVEATLAQVRAASMRFDYRILRAPAGTLLAEGSTLLAAVDGRGALRRLAAEEAAVLAQPETT